MWQFFTIQLLLLGMGLSCATVAVAQGSCGAAGGAPAGPAFSVCDFAREAAGLPAPGPALGAGNPIDLATGNKYRHELDLRIDAHVPLVVARHYNSRNRHAGALGIGWSHSFETRVAQVTVRGRPELQIIQGDGRRRVFTPEGARTGRWRGAQLADGIIDSHRSQSARWTWHWPAQAGSRALQFNAQGRLVAVLRDGRPVLQLGHDDRGRLVRLVGIERWTLDFEYLDHPHGTRLESIQSPSGLIARYRYDDTGQLASVQWRDGRSRQFRYDDPNDPLLLTSVTEADADPAARPTEVASYAYDAQGRAIRTTDTRLGESLAVAYIRGASGTAPGLTTVTDSNGKQASYRWTYDRHRHVTRLIESSGQACMRCPPAPRRFEWSAAGELRRIEADGTSLVFEHDPLGRPTAAWRLQPGKTRSLIWRVSYAGANPLAGPEHIEQPSVAPGRWHRIHIERDALGRPVAVTESGYRPAKADVGVQGNTVRYLHQSRRFSLGHRRHQPGHPTEGKPPGNWLSALDWVDGPLPGEADRIHIQQIGDLLNVMHPDGAKESLVVDDGILSEHQSARGYFARMDRNPLDSQWLGGPTLTGAFIGPRKIDLQYEGFGGLQSVRMEDFEQHRARTVRAVAPEMPGIQSSSATLQALSHWRGQATAIQLPDGSVFRRGFDDFGRVSWIDEPGQPRQWAEYDESDRLVVHRPGDGSVLHHQRDPLGRLVASTRTGRGGTVLIGRYRWEGHRLAQADNDTVSIHYEWDRLARLTGAEYRFASRPDKPLQYRWHYDLASRLVAEDLPGALSVRYQYQGRKIVGIELTGLPASRPGDTRLNAQALELPLQLFSFTPQSVTVNDVQREAGLLLQAGGMRHTFDPHRRRAARRPATDEPNATSGTEFVHHDWRLRTERLADGSLRHWIWAQTRPIALIDNGRLLRVHTDSRAAPIRVVDASGQTLWSAQYNRQGAARIAPDARIAVSLRLPGQIFDPETGWHHNHRRTYSPLTGQYLEPDPLGLQSEYVGKESLTDYAGGDPIRGLDPWGLATLSWFAVTTDAAGKPLGRTQGFERARWSFMIEDILPVPLIGSGQYPPQPAGIDGLLFDPWGDFIGSANAPRLGSGNQIDSLAWTGASGKQVFAAFAAHYGGALASPQRFVVEGFDDRRAGALALILAASPSQRQACVSTALADLPGLSLGPAEPILRPADPRPEAARVLECSAPTTLPVPYRDDIERSRVERYQAAAELQESPSAAIGEDCAKSVGCRSRARIDVNGHSYFASYGRTQFTVTTFLGELGRMTQASGGADAASLRAALKLDSPVVLEGRSATLNDALSLARRRVEGAYRSFAAIRGEFGRGLDAGRAAQVWDTLSPTRRTAFASDTGLGREGFIDMLGYVATGIGGRTEEEGRHALAASAAATVRYTATNASSPQSFDDWLIALYSSRDAYDHVSRAFLRDNLRRVLSAPSLAGRFANTARPESPEWFKRQSDIELDLARRVAVLHNSGRLDLATSPTLDNWLTGHPSSWITGYVTQFTTLDSRGNWEALRCTTGLGGRQGLQFSKLSAMPQNAQLPASKPGRSLLR